jgi:DNA-binding LytR/AlgR family response regulator
MTLTEKGCHFLSARSYPQGLENFVRINRSEIVNLNAIDGFEGNCYYIGKNPLYATGVYRQRMEGVFVKTKQQ